MDRSEVGKYLKKKITQKGYGNRNNGSYKRTVWITKPHAGTDIDSKLNSYGISDAPSATDIDFSEERGQWSRGYHGLHVAYRIAIIMNMYVICMYK